MIRVAIVATAGSAMRHAVRCMGGAANVAAVERDRER